MQESETQESGGSEWLNNFPQVTQQSQCSNFGFTPKGKMLHCLPVTKNFEYSKML